MDTNTNDTIRQKAVASVLAMAEIKAVTAAFDRGQTNIFDTLSAIAGASEPYRVANLDWWNAA